MKRITILFFIGLLVMSTIAHATVTKIKVTEQGGFELIVDDKPFIAKGVGYSPISIGKGYDYDFFADPNKPWLVDGKLMKEAGINCIRIYSVGSNLENTRSFIKEMYEQFGIYTIVSDWLGLWNYPAANYAEKDFCEKTKKKILDVVNTLKNEPGILMWALGNENNYTFSGKIGYWTSPEIEKITDFAKRITKKAEIYYTFVDDLALEIKKIDPNHLVALGNGEATSLDVAGRVCKNIDILALIIYRGKKFGNVLNNVKSFFNKPIIIAEFGCDSYDAHKKIENQDIQAEFILSQWQDLYKNTVTSGNLQGNCVGGVVFEWHDEWWKHNEGYTPDWSVHNKEAGWSNGSYYFDINAKDNLNINEEWFGIVSLSEELENGINKRIPKKSYYALKNVFIETPAAASNVAQKNDNIPVSVNKEKVVIEKSAADKSLPQSSESVSTAPSK